MDKDTLLWLLGVLVTINTSITVGGIKAYVQVMRNQNDMDKRLVKMETTLELLGFNAAKALHSPHTPELDVLLEKYCRMYEERHYDLPDEDWSKLNDICKEILDDTSLTSGYRAAAGMVQALCVHKMMRSKG